MLDEKIQSELIAKGRAFTHGYLENDPYEEDFQSDQELKRPQPPLCKAPMRLESARIALPRDFEALEREEGPGQKVCHIADRPLRRRAA